MRKHIKLIFYSIAVAVLGGMTMWEIVATRSAQIGSGEKSKEVGVEQVRAIVAKWNKREKFNFTSTEPAETPEVTRKPTKAVTPTPEASPSGEEQ